MRSKGRAPCLDQHPWGFQPLPPGKPLGPELSWWVRATCTKPALKQTPELSHHSDTSGEGFCRAKEISTLLLPLILISLHSHAARWMRTCDCTSYPSSLCVFPFPPRNAFLVQLSKSLVYWYSPYQTLQCPARSLVLSETGTLARLAWSTGLG